MYKLVNRVNPMTPDSELQYGPVAVYESGETTFERLTELISLRSSMTAADVEAVLQAFITSLILEVSNSHAVELGGFGTVFASIGTEQVDEPEAYTASMIRGARFRFRPGKRVRNKIAQVKFTRVKESAASDSPDEEQA